eukprot:TRINITY_DN46840_c0_g1_i1.p3 TRINITY_DN46840_c0_g1~~TRINITY_DN46840_c0_g1_i1.p3  ORF type:complete len:302 (+),score=148.67 TRINITY_DN46840_c0_g1_i1:66-908(+)
MQPSRAEVRSRMLSFYAAHHPTKVEQIDGILDRYAGKEGAVLQAMQLKYPQWDFSAASPGNDAAGSALASERTEATRVGQGGVADLLRRNAELEYRCQRAEEERDAERARRERAEADASEMRRQREAEQQLLQQLRRELQQLRSGDDSTERELEALLSSAAGMRERTTLLQRENEELLHLQRHAVEQITAARTAEAAKALADRAASTASAHRSAAGASDAAALEGALQLLAAVGPPPDAKFVSPVPPTRYVGVGLSGRVEGRDVAAAAVSPARYGAPHPW